MMMDKDKRIVLTIELTDLICVSNFIRRNDYGSYVEYRGTVKILDHYLVDQMKNKPAG